MPCVASQKTIASKNPLASWLVNWSDQCWPASAAAGPGDFSGDGADPSEVFGAVRSLYLRGRLGLSEDRSHREQEQSQRSRHRAIVAEKLPAALAAGSREH